MMNYEKLIFEISKEGRRGSRLSEWAGRDNTEDIFGKGNVRANDAELPEVTEPEVIRHYTLLSNKNFGVDTGFYPLGSCTMKYNPKINEDMASLPGFAAVHPYQTEELAQGALELMYDLNEQLCKITGMDEFSLQPAAGAHGELAGLMTIKAYHEKNNDAKRNKIIVPDSAHGTNPASAAVAGFEIVEIKSAADGSIDLEALKAVLDDTIAGFMLTNPSTLGLFEKNIKEVARLIHEAGGLLYYDGANLNAIMGIVRPGDMGFDVMHINLHKTFSTPHGGGGPGSGPVGVRSRLVPFLPVPKVVRTENGYKLESNFPDSIGQLRSFYGNFMILVRAYTYILSLGGNGLKEASETAVINANYMKEKLRKNYELAYDNICMHEFVLAGLGKDEHYVSTLDIAKRLLDYGYHPPTIYFPLIVDGSIMVEPTETESKETMDAFIETMIKISVEAKETPELLKNAPYNTYVRRLDEVTAARTPILRYIRK